MNTLKQILLTSIFSTIMVLPAQATDSAKEERWANQVTDFLIDGEPEWLEANGKKFLGIYTPASTDKTTGAVILLHGRGVHPDWPQVIQPLRSQLPDKGWATLSLQMPVLPNNAYDRDYVPLFKEVPERINAGLDFLSQQNINNIVLMGHSLGANMASDFLARQGDRRVNAFVGIGMMGLKQPAGYRVLDNVASLQKIKLPVLDIYGSKTNDKVLYTADRRARVIKRTGHIHSRQIKIDGSNHFFQGYEDILLNNIATWLDETTGRNKQSASVVNANAN